MVLENILNYVTKDTLEPKIGGLYNIFCDMMTKRKLYFFILGKHSPIHLYGWKIVTRKQDRIQKNNLNPL